MLSEFYNEVLTYGPLSVLPQNLNDKWIQRFQKMADDFLDSNFNLYECKDAREIGDPIIAACVYEILRYQYGDKFDLTPHEMAIASPILGWCRQILTISFRWSESFRIKKRNRNSLNY
jgi:hypothetical protein